MKKFFTSSLFLLFLSIHFFGQAELLDPAFGEGGKICHPILGGRDDPQQMTIQLDGKILVAGTSRYDDTTRYTLLRYLSDGTLDPTFGDGKSNITQSPPSWWASGISDLQVANNGTIKVVGRNHYIEYQPDGSYSSGFELQNGYKGGTIQSDGKVVAIKYVGPKAIAVTRFEADGSFDDTFNQGNDSLLIAFDSNAYHIKVLVQPDGKILLGGHVRTEHNKNDFYVIRLLENGSMDDSFGENGIVQIDRVGADDFMQTLVLRENGKIVFGGRSGITNAIIVQLLPNGQLDSSFSGNGMLILPNDAVISSKSIFDIDIAEDSTIIAAGRYDTFLFASGAFLAKIEAHGEVDLSFGDSTGLLDIDFEPYSVSVKWQDDHIIAAGDFASDYGVTKYLSDGTADPSFNGGELVLTDVGEGILTGMNDLFLQTDGKIILAGGADYQAAIYRFDEKGQRDSSFNEVGYENFRDQDIYQWIGTVNTVHVLDDEHILIGGDFNFLMQTLPDGTIDSTYSSDYVCTVNDMIVAPDGKVTTAGVTENGNSVGTCVAKFNADGSIDSSFHFTRNEYHKDHYPFIEMQGDDHFLLAGSRSVARHFTDGSIDTGFGEEGVFVVPLDSLWNLDTMYPPPPPPPPGYFHKIIFSLKVLPDEKILLAGVLPNWDFRTFFLIQLNKNGVIDTNFGNSGFVIIELEEGEAMNDMDIQPNGKIVVAGTRNDDFCMIRFLPDGNLDETVGDSGYIFTDFNGKKDEAFHIAVQDDGKILLAGKSGSKHALVRYLPDLSVDVEQVFTVPQSLMVFPNPAFDFLSIEFPENTTDLLAVQIFDSNGQLSGQQVLRDGQPIDIGDLPSGFYTLKLKDGGRVYVGKFIKQ